LNVFFDKTADKNIGVDAVFTLGTGMAQMFEKIGFRHGLSKDLFTIPSAVEKYH
jgi:hypothetical protein